MLENSVLLAMSVPLLRETDEVVNQRVYGVLPLNYGAAFGVTHQVAPVGIEPTTSGL